MYMYIYTYIYIYTSCMCEYIYIRIYILNLLHSLIILLNCPSGTCARRFLLHAI